MKRLVILLFFLFLFAISYSQTTGSYWRVTKWTTPFGQNLPDSTRIMVKDSAKDYQIHHIGGVLSTQTMAFAYAQGWVSKIPKDLIGYGLSGIETDPYYHADTGNIAFLNQQNSFTKPIRLLSIANSLSDTVFVDSSGFPKKRLKSTLGFQPTYTGLQDSLNDRYRRKDTASVLLSKTRYSHDTVNVAYLNQENTFTKKQIFSNASRNETTLKSTNGSSVALTFDRSAVSNTSYQLLDSVGMFYCMTRSSYGSAWAKGPFYIDGLSIIFSNLNISSNGQSAGFSTYYNHSTNGYNLFYGTNPVFMTGTGDNASWNTGIGYDALQNITTGSKNVALGYHASRLATTATNLVSIGYQAGYGGNNVPTGSDNILIGYQAGYRGVQGANNIHIGTQAGYYSITAHDNTYIGYQSGYTDNTGYNNLFAGSTSGYTNFDGYDNVFLGGASGYYNSHGKYNTLVGYYSGAFNIDNNYNTYLGYATGVGNGAAIETSRYDSLMVYIGASASKHNTSTLQNGIAIGYNAKVLQSNQVVLGNTSITSTMLNGVVNITTLNNSLSDTIVVDSSNNLKKRLKSTLGFQPAAQVYEYEISTDAENNITVPFALKSTSLVFYNSQVISSTRWSGTGTTTLNVSLDTRKNDKLIIQM